MIFHLHILSHLKEDQLKSSSPWVSRAPNPKKSITYKNQNSKTSKPDGCNSNQLRKTMEFWKMQLTNPNQVRCRDGLRVFTFQLHCFLSLQVKIAKKKKNQLICSKYILYNFFFGAINGHKTFVYASFVARCVLTFNFYIFFLNIM